MNHACMHVSGRALHAHACMMAREGDHAPAADVQATPLAVIRTSMVEETDQLIDWAAALGPR